jgi:mRNA-degrading endonuclease RelE of RelBE toxin-antitoxin system
MVNIVTIPTFEKNAKKIAKRDKLLFKDLQKLFEILTNNPREGTSLGNNCYKIRIQNSSAKRGKSGGYRVVSYYCDKEVLGLLTIYSKSDRENIFQNEIDELIRELSEKLK